MPAGDDDLLDTVPAGVLALDGDLRIRAANAYMGRILERAPAELIGQVLESVLSASSRILLQTHVVPMLASRGYVEEALLSLESSIPVLFNAIRLDGDAMAYRALIVPIRARTRWEQELLAATRSLAEERAASQRLGVAVAESHGNEERAREFREAFIGVVSHELRTPITTIFGMSQVLQRRHASFDAAELQEHLSDIAAEADRLRTLTEDLLILSRAEGGGLQLASEPVLLGRLVDAAVSAQQARTPGQSIIVDVAATDRPVNADGLYVEQVIRNLLSNATKYGGETEIAVTVEVDGAGSAVRVRDGGPGLAGQDPERLFDLFYRSDRVTHTTDGAGIGLFVCRALIEAMAGRVWAADRLDTHGAEFGFWLPAIADDGG